MLVDRQTALNAHITVLTRVIANRKAVCHSDDDRPHPPPQASSDLEVKELGYKTSSFLFCTASQRAEL